MKNLWIIGLGVAAITVATIAATSRADEVAAPVVAPQIAWGETSNGLQLGVRYDDKPRTYRRGETAPFDLIARNVGKKAVKINYYSPLFPVPFVADENGKPVTSVLKSPPPPGYPVGAKTLALAPGAQTLIQETELRIGSPIVPTLFWALDSAPGKYRVGFKVQLDAPFDSKGKRVPLGLKSGFAPLEITATAPTQGTEFAAQLPPGALVKEAPYTWGQEVNGLQLGIRLSAPGQVIPATKQVSLGTLVRFDLAMRNVSDAPLNAFYVKGQWSISPRVTHEDGSQLSLYAQADLFGAARDGQVFFVTKTLQAGESAEFGRAWLAIGAPVDKEYRDPVLTVEPGRYRVRYSYDFTPDYHRKSVVTDPETGEKRLPPKDDKDITSSEIILEVAPAKTTQN